MSAFPYKPAQPFIDNPVPLVGGNGIFPDSQELPNLTLDWERVDRVQFIKGTLHPFFGGN